MPGRKPLVLSSADINALFAHVKNLPFKRKIDERFLVMIQNKKNMHDFSQADLELVKKCRYEMNAHQKQMSALAKIKQLSSHSRFELDILALDQKPDIDAYFLKLDALKEYLKQANQKLAMVKLQNQKKKLEKKQNDPALAARKKRDRENYFLGASLRKLLEATQLFDGQNEVVKLYSLVNAARFAQFITETQVVNIQHLEVHFNHMPEAQLFLQAIQEVVEDPRNPFAK